MEPIELLSYGHVEFHKEAGRLPYPPCLLLMEGNKPEAFLFHYSFYTSSMTQKNI